MQSNIIRDLCDWCSNDIPLSKFSKICSFCEKEFCKFEHLIYHEYVYHNKRHESIDIFDEAIMDRTVKKA